MPKATIDESLMPDLPDMPEEGKPIPREGDEPDGEPNNDKPVNYIPKQMPADIYYSAGDAELEQMLPYLIGRDSTAKLKVLALGRNVRPVAVLRQGIISSDDYGCFEPLGADANKDKQLKRTGNDDRAEFSDNRRMMAVLGASAFDVILKHGRENRLSNRAALYFGVRRILEVSMV